MHRVLPPFEIAEPTTVSEVVEPVDGERSRVLAGGVDLVLKMRLRQIVPETVVSLERVPDLNHVAANGDLRIGAMATLRQVELDPAVRERWPLLWEAVAAGSSKQTKAMGTLVGNLCVGTPASDIAPALYALGATIEIVGASGARQVPIGEFFLDVGKTAVGPHEMVTSVIVPDASGSKGAFVKLGKSADDIAKINAAVCVRIEDGACVDAKIGLGSVAPTPIGAAQAEAVLVGAKLSEATIAEAAVAAAEAAKPISDLRSTAEYRREMVRVLVKDALARATGQAEA